MIAPAGRMSAGTCLAIVPVVSEIDTPVRRVEPVAPCTARLDRRADFLAQLIAVRDGFPQAAARRRASTSDAIRAYDDAARLGGRAEPVEQARA